MPLQDYTIIFGGSFSPPTFGHYTACQWLIQTLGAKRITIVPTYEHAFNKQLISFEHRLEMCAQMFPPNNSEIIVSGIERGLPHPNRTIDTINYLLPLTNNKLGIAIGSDLVDEFPTWANYEEILKLAKVVIIGRAGHTKPINFPCYNYPISVSEISSTDIRNKIKLGQDITGLVSKSVKEYIEINGLYK